MAQIAGYTRTADCRYIDPAFPLQIYVSKARAHEINPDANERLLYLLRKRDIGPKANKVNERLVLYRVEDIASTDFKRLAAGDDVLTGALNGFAPVSEQEPVVEALRLLNTRIRTGDVVVTLRDDGTIRLLMEVG